MTLLNCWKPLICLTNLPKSTSKINSFWSRIYFQIPKGAQNVPLNPVKTCTRHIYVDECIGYLAHGRHEILAHATWEMKSWGWRNSPAVKSTDWSSRGLGSIPSTNMVVSQLPVTLVLADPMPASGLCRCCMHAGQTHRHKITWVSNFLRQGVTMHPWLTWNPLCIE